MKFARTNGPGPCQKRLTPHPTCSAQSDFIVKLRFLPLISACVATLLLAGCETPPDTERPNLTEKFVVKRGMPAEELVAVLGEPDIRQPVAEYSVDAEIWVYNRTVGSDSKMVLMGTERRAFWDPIRRQVYYLDMPVYQPEVTAAVEVSEIMMVKDQVYSWERRTGGRRSVEGNGR